MLHGTYENIPNRTVISQAQGEIKGEKRKQNYEGIKYSLANNNEYFIQLGLKHSAVRFC